MLRYAITDRALFGGSTDTQDALLDGILTLAGSMDSLQIRERDLSAAELERFTTRVIAALSHLPTRPRVLVNHRADIAMVCGADGVHLRSPANGELSPEDVLAMYEKAALPRPVISASCHSLEEIAACRGAELILFGPVFEKVVTGANSIPGLGLESLRRACVSAHPGKVFALGGVTEANAVSCIEAGAAGVAGIRLFFQALK
jgi:thiamine-phosphate pyrophosphorylase